VHCHSLCGWAWQVRNSHYCVGLSNWSRKNCCFNRAPVLVAIALIEYGMDAISAVTFIRERRYGASSRGL
jgi:hypothetical protein